MSLWRLSLSSQQNECLSVPVRTRVDINALTARGSLSVCSQPLCKRCSIAPAESFWQGLLDSLGYIFSCQLQKFLTVLIRTRKNAFSKLLLKNVCSIVFPRPMDVRFEERSFETDKVPARSLVSFVCQGGRNNQNIHYSISLQGHWPYERLGSQGLLLPMPLHQSYFNQIEIDLCSAPNSTPPWPTQDLSPFGTLACGIGMSTLAAKSL